MISDARPTSLGLLRAPRAGAALLGIAALASGCSRDRTPPTPVATASATSGASAAPSASASAERPAPDDEVRPVYPVTRDPPDPLAVRLCDALHALPAQRRAACRGGAPGFHAAAECARTLSFALRSRAVTLAPADVDRCVEAIERAHQGCGWVTPLAPPPPPECEGIVRGALSEGAACRSSLECAAGLRCAGVGPTDPGRCRPPQARGPCGRSVDTLAVHTRQTRYELAHPECAGHCARRACADDVPAGGACRSHVECGRDRRCAGGRCSGSGAPLPGPSKP